MKAIHDIKHHCQRGQNLLICLTNSMKTKVLFRPSTIINFFAAISVCLDLGCPWNSNGYTKETQVVFLPLSVQGKYPSSSQEVVTTSMTFLYIGMKDDSFKWKTRWQSSKKVSHSSSSHHWKESPFILHQVSQQDFPFGQVCKSVCGFN